MEREKGARKVLNNIGRKVSRANHDSMGELYQARENGAWNNLSTGQKAYWIIKNPVAYGRVRHDEDLLIPKAKRIADKRRKEEILAHSYINEKFNPGPVSMLTTDKDGNLQIGFNTTDQIDLGATKTKVAEQARKLFDAEKNCLAPAVQKAYLSTGSSGLSEVSSYLCDAGSGLGVLNDTGDIIGNITTLSDVIESSDEMKIGAALEDLIGQFSSLGYNIVGMTSSILKSSGVELGAEIAGSVASGLNIVSGIAKTASGAFKTAGGIRKWKHMDSFIEDMEGNPSMTESDANSENAKFNQLLKDIAIQTKMEGKRQTAGGVQNTISGALATISAGLLAGGVTISAALAINIVNTLMKLGFAVGDKHQRTLMKEEVVKQTTGIDDDVIKDFQVYSGIKDWHRAKQALMKALGYTSGWRAELVADQTEKRGQLLANSSGNSMAVQLAEGMGVHSGKDGQYDKDKLSKAMGQTKSRMMVFKDSNPIAYNAAKK